MPTLHLLGTGASISEPGRGPTMLAVEDPGSILLVDCGGDALGRLLGAVVPGEPAETQYARIVAAVGRIEAIILTHEHADHIAGFPLLWQGIWLAKRRRPLPVLGPRSALKRARRLLRRFKPKSWNGAPGALWGAADLVEGFALFESADWKVTSTPGEHGKVDALALRIESRRGGGVVAYSGDTTYSQQIARLSHNADILVHEATGAGGGHHSTAGDAARVAAEAGVGRLLLVHLPPADLLPPEELDEARGVFERLEKGIEGGRYAFGAADGSR